MFWILKMLITASANMHLLFRSKMH